MCFKKQEIKSIEKYLKWYLDYFKKNPPENEFISDMFNQIIDLTKAIKLLLKNNLESECLILNRTLGEIAILIFVVCSLKEKPQKAYLAIYELHGWFEILDIFEKFDFKKHKEESEEINKIYKKIEKLKKIIIEEFSDSGEVVDDEKLKKFVRNKLSRNIYGDAKILLEQRYKDLPTIQSSVSKILKENGHYQTESNFTHGRYLSTFFKNTKIKIAISKDVINRMHLPLTIYSLDNNVKIPDINSLIKTK